MASLLAVGLRIKGCEVITRLGFGDLGFLSEVEGTSCFMRVDRPVLRKLLYPLWLIAENLFVFSLLRGRAILWLNAVYAVPAAIPFLIFAPKRAIIHVHENRIPRSLQWLIAWAYRRGATVLAVSAHHQRMLPVPAIILANAVGTGPMPTAPSSRDQIVFVGTTSEAKGYPLLIDLVRRLNVPNLQVHAFLAGGIDAPPPSLIAEAQALGIIVTIGEPDPAIHHARSFLSLQLTDPTLADETFSLVAAEAVWHLVPVGGAGAEVLPEVAGGALAFNISSRDPQAIADAIAELWSDPGRYAALVDSAGQRRARYDLSRFVDTAFSIAEAAHR